MKEQRGRGAGRVSRKEAAAGHSALAAILQENLHPAMRSLVSEADRRGITLAQLSGLTDRKPEALKRSFRAKRPQLATLTALTIALDLQPVTARALMGNLSDRDEWELRIEVGQEVLGRGAMFADALALFTALNDVFLERPPERRRKALAIFEVTRRGLGDTDTIRNAAPAAALVALCKALEFDLNRFFAPEVILETRVLEAAAALDWFLDSLPFSERDKDCIKDLARKYGLDSKALVFRGALSRAKHEFRRTIGHEYSYADALAETAATIGD